MKLKRITDLEDALILWQAGLVVNKIGRKWARYNPGRYLKEQRELLRDYMLGYPEHVCVLVEEDGDESAEHDHSTKCDKPCSGEEAAYYYLQNTD